MSAERVHPLGCAGVGQLDKVGPAAAFIAGRPVSCRPVFLDPYGRTVAACTVGAGIDLGEWLVGRGQALDWPLYSHGTYGAAQEDAERAGRGIWAGSCGALGVSGVRAGRGEASQKGTPRMVDSGEGQKPASKEVGFLVRDSSNVSGRRRTAAAVVVAARCRLAGNRRRREW